MRPVLSRVLSLSVFLATIGCAASGSSEEEGPTPQRYRKVLGKATINDLGKYTRQVFERYHYEFERIDESQYSTVYVTRWQGRYPYDDEIAAGVVEAQTRFIVRSGPATGPSALASVEFVAESRVRIGDGLQWTAGFMTPMFHEMADRISEALKTELQTGFRVR